MNRTEKAAEIESLNQGFQNSRNAFLVGFSGLTVEQVNVLRRKVSESDSSYRVMKNRLAKRAIIGTPLEALLAEFKGPTAVAYNSTDPVALAKALADFAKDHPALLLRVGLVDGKQVIDEKDVKALAKLPGIQELRAQLLCLIQTPATQLARLVATPATQIAQVLKARQEKLAEAQ